MNGSGSILTAAVVAQLPDSNPPLGGSYFSIQSNPVAQATSSGNGTGATFNLTQGSAAPQRVILTNQEFATAVYCRDVTDPNVMDDMFQDAWAKVLGATITIPLTGDKKLANMAIQEANASIQYARTGDANDGFTINDVTPDWLRIRGIDIATPYSGPYTGYDWGGLYPIFG